MPWNKPNNPYDGKKRKKIDIYPTTVEIQCEGCISEGQRNRSINLRVLAEDFDNEGKAVKRKHCSRCMAQTQFTMIVYSNGAIHVTQANRFGADEHAVAFRKVDQRRVKIEVEE